ncbi:subtilisin-like protease SBT2.4 [Phragmites australis]|uniref:subtilisin-like protease SBT2.4 n=1 Tax=Phragmites australis TaxID=29695 RepID=UPI002D7A0B26|nr:subtilisin-like protease SBT2.4 [Phragmites australis]
MSSRQRCFLIPMLFVATLASAAAAVVVRAKLDDDHEEKSSIYLVLVHGETLAAALQRKGEVDRNATWYQAQKRRVAQLHDRVLRRAMDGGGNESFYCRKLYSFHHAINGFAVHTTALLAERLSAAPEVAAVEEDLGTRIMTTYTPRLLGLPEGLWRRRDGEGDDGDGVVVGVVDTGIDPAHPSFAYVPQWRADRPNDDCERRRGAWPFAGGACSVGPRFPPGSCNGKIVTARYFAAGAAAVLPLDASRDLSPFDAEGHGSHVASIAAGNRGVPVVVGGAMYGYASGMAPGARLAVYKAVYPAGGTMADLISAIDQATQDKVDVLVLSVGPDARPTSKVTFLSMLEVALLSASKAGVFVAQAAGNQGPAEFSLVSYSPWVMTVAAGTTGWSYTARLVLGDGRHIPGLGLSAPTLHYRLVAAKDAAAPDSASMGRAEECQDAETLRWRADVLRGSIVVCSFSQGFYNGTSTVTAILDVAEALGFAGFVLLANLQYGDFVAQPLPFRVPGVMVPRVDNAEVIWSYYAEHTVYAGSATVFGATAAINEGRVATFTDAAPVVARYSSRGPDVANAESTPADVLKPDILAPGNQIWAAWSALSTNEPILAGNHFAMISGTSMAAPHVGGVAALIKQRHPSLRPSAIASALSTTARRHDDREGQIMAEGFELGSLHPATPFDCGSGSVNPAAALDPGLVIAPEPDDYISFLCSLPQLSPEDVRAATGAACQAPLAFPADLNLPSVTVSALRGYLFVRRRVTNVGSNTETYLCSALPPAGVDVTVRPGWFEVAPGGTQEVVIELRVTNASGAFSFGEIVLTGSLDHLVRLPLAVRSLGTT